MSTPPGWFPDPQIPATLRWWDGQRWTEHTAPMEPAAARPAQVAPTPEVQRQAVAPTPEKKHKVGFFGAKSTAEQALVENERLRAELERLGAMEIADLAAERDRLAAETEQARATLESERSTLAARVATLKQQVIETEEAVILQEVGIYEFKHVLADSVAYKDEIARLRSSFKALAKSPGGAVSATTTWSVNGSAREGTKMVRDFSKLMLLAYNSEADTIVAGMKPYKLEAAKARLEKVAHTIERLGKTMSIRITYEYHRLRLKELELVADYQEKLAREKEADRERREQLREEARAQAEFEREKARLQKQQALTMQALAKARASGDQEAIDRLLAEVEDAQRALDEVDHRATNLRLGHVYVISNVGAFGEGVVKIGMTRRMEPMERVRELGDASVPFRFDVHTLVYSEDAVALETRLHQRFAAQRLNKVNLRREFFRASPSAVREALIEFGATIVEYNDEPLAEEYRMSQSGATEQALV